jgi:hypothetical protein
MVCSIGKRQLGETSTGSVESLPLELGKLASPEGREQNSPGLQPWEAVRKRTRPERAAENGALFPKVTSVERPSMISIEYCAHIHVGNGPGHRLLFSQHIFCAAAGPRFGRPFRAMSLCVSFPGLKPWAVFFSPFGRFETRARKCLSCKAPRTDFDGLSRAAAPTVRYDPLNL